MTINILELLKIELYVALIILAIVLIIFVIKMIKSLRKFDQTFDLINTKLNQMNGVFNIVEKTGSFADEVSNQIIMAITNLIGRFIERKKGNDCDE